MTYGLIGYPLSHSFSRRYFTEKFERLGLSETNRYLNFELERVESLEALRDQYPDLRGLNVTIPHKRNVLPLLDAIDPVAERIGAVNTIRVDANGRFTGFNTDWIGFRDSLLSEFASLAGRPTGRYVAERNQALILGSGGASLAIQAALDDLSIHHQTVSRTPGRADLTYVDITPELLARTFLLVNTTPLGMSPNVDTYPDLPYAALTPDHFCFDLIYNPEETAFMRRARTAGAVAANGLGMLVGQAEAAWGIWNRGR